MQICSPFLPVSDHPHSRHSSAPPFRSYRAPLYAALVADTVQSPHVAPMYPVRYLLATQRQRSRFLYREVLDRVRFGEAGNQTCTG
jgi:hypothetical protein